MRMPTTPGLGYIFTVMFARVGGNGMTGTTAISFEVDVVVPNTPPVLSLPGPIEAEAASAAGTTVTYTATAADAEDNPDPTPVCSPVSGSVFALGTTTVTCTVTDTGNLPASGSFTVSIADTTAPVLVLPGDLSAEATSPSGASVDFTASASDAVDGDVPVSCDHASGDTFGLGTTTVTCSAVDAAGNPTSGTFDVTVSDTTGPTLNDVPANISVTTGNPAGATVSYTMPTASDAGDPNPSVGCDPAPGSFFGVGPTTVTCTATDAAGHTASATFVVTVTYVAPPPDVTWSALWGTPVDPSPSVFVTNQNRTVPIKVRIFANGVEQTSGSAALRVVTCGGDTALVVPLAWGSGRWNAHLDMSLLGPGCYNVMATLGGNDAGSFALDVRGPERGQDAGPRDDHGAGQGQGQGPEEVTERAASAAFSTSSRRAAPPQPWIAARWSAVP